VEGSYELLNEMSGSIKFWEVLKKLHNWVLLKKCSATWSWLYNSLQLANQYRAQ
jgi:hypothetical protein